MRHFQWNGQLECRANLIALKVTFAQWPDGNYLIVQGEWCVLGIAYALLCHIWPMSRGHYQTVAVTGARACQSVKVNCHRARAAFTASLTEGTLSLVQQPSDNSRSRISHANIEGHSRLYCAILDTTSDVATRGLLPPIARGRIEPVS